MYVPRRKALVISLVSFGVISMLSSPILPLYDGVGFPDEAYRYLQPPAGTKATRPPIGGSMASSVKDGTNTDILEIVTPENGPQALIVLLPGTVRLNPSTAEIVQVDISPVKPTILPRDGKLAGNIYALTANPSAIKGDIAPMVTLDTGDPNNNTHLISLRLPQGGAANPMLEYRASDSQTWQKGVTEKVGADIYRTAIKGFGEYALVEQKQPASVASPKAKTELPLFIIVSATVLLVLIITIASIRHSRKRTSKPAKRSNIRKDGKTIR